MMVDKLLTQQQCDQLIQLASYGKEGDGYERKSPHTENEKFEGLHLLEAAKRSSYGEIEPSLSWLYVNASRWSKDMVAKVFKLESPLYFSYTYLVCRTSKEGKQESHRDLSHPVHSDNCILDDLTGECNKVAPAYTWRDYSALLYLNGVEDFEGGEFFYAHSTKDLSPDVLVKPECGRLVGFSAGKENMHGVLPVTGGRRCAVALWFTLDPQHSEVAFDQAEDLLISL
ncbi:prolyl 3-hydroxylase 2-like [Halichondria panicea]|uniref:prolyl 3-hydroxylase 2-like n=1 Tax=Halichondria panicea TaxID=6063 RepID=UPI00312BA4AF